ncbi:MAG: helix-turn-helix transcriptional regulator [Halobacteriales archaeon]|nr:helix-turn-helix transcriptional regulator [Halobacteriales archaeon]
MPLGIRRDTKASAPPKKKEMEGTRTGPVPARSEQEQSEINARMIGELDAFLDELAEGHRKAMDQVVTWLTGYGDLDREVQRSVEALNPLLQKWSIEICFLLRMKEPRRFNELKEQLPGIGSRTLSQRLKELELQGIVQRTVFPEVPVRVEYRLTPKGSRMGDLFLPIIAHLRIAGWREGLGAKREKDADAA